MVDAADGELPGDERVEHAGSQPCRATSGDACTRPSTRFQPPARRALPESGAQITNPERGKGHGRQWGHRSGGERDGRGRAYQRLGVCSPAQPAFT